MTTRPLHRTLVLFTAFCLFAWPGIVRAQDSAAMDPDSEPETRLNWALPTMGGKQFWTDLVNLHGYRIQRNATSGHCRLLSPRNRRLAWGNFTGCRQRLEEIARDEGLEPVRGRVLIVLHGLMRTRSAMQQLAECAARETDLHVINISYASGRAGLEDHAAALDSVIQHLPEATEINFVGHSMGNIVVRYYLGIRGHDPRFRRMVMLAPPNHGSTLARLLQSNVVFTSVTGESGQQLARRWDDIAGHLATPAFEFAIITGSTEDGRISNPMVSGPNDLVVQVDETRLRGAADFLQGPWWHSTIMNNEEVHKAAVSFLETGRLRADGERQPITEDLASAADGALDR